MSLGWFFPGNQAEEDEGLAHAGIETFKDAPFSALARECAQNSMDAAREGNSAEPVRIVFTRKTITTASIPDVAGLRSTLECCLKSANRRRSQKEVDFFARAIELLQKPTLSILDIADYGTTGLVGPSEYGTSFHALVKASGVSNKAQADAGGSFGIGKNAAFAISSLRTVFYSTIYQQGGNAYLSQGKAVLVSHTAPDGPKKATGYWGTPNFQAIDDESKLPEWLHRSELGTSVTALGFNGSDDWIWRTAESLIRNFFAAIHRKQLELELRDEGAGDLHINAANLGSLFQHPEVTRSATEGGYPDDLQFSSAMLRAMTDADAITSEEVIDGVGKVEIRVLVKDKLPKRVGILRNGMYVTDSLRHFNDKLTRFALCRDFVAIIEPADRRTSELIRSLENPRHDELSPERIEPPQKRGAVSLGFKRLIRKLRDIIKQNTMSVSQRETMVEELSRFFASPVDSRNSASREGKETDPKSIKVRTRKVERKPAGTGNDGRDGSAGGEKRNDEAGGRSSGEREGAGRGEGGGRGGSTVPFTAPRNLVPDVGSGNRRLVWFTPEKSGRARLELRAGGTSSTVSLKVTSINGETATSNYPVLLQAGIRVALDVGFEPKFTGPIEIVLTAKEEPDREA